MLSRTTRLELAALSLLTVGATAGCAETTMGGAKRPKGSHVAANPFQSRLTRTNPAFDFGFDLRGGPLGIP